MAEAVDELARRLAALEERLDALLVVVRRLAEAGASESSDELAAAARLALRITVPEMGPEPEVIPAWGCPRCGRVDAPQPCLDVCVRVPVAMVDASEYRSKLSAVEQAEAADRLLTPVATLAGHVRPRSGNEAQTRAVMRSRARAALAVAGPTRAAPEAR